MSPSPDSNQSAETPHRCAIRTVNELLLPTPSASASVLWPMPTACASSGCVRPAFSRASFSRAPKGERSRFLIRHSVAIPFIGTLLLSSTESRYDDSMDWKSVIADLQRAGYTQPQIAEACRCGQSTISEIFSGRTSQPRADLGLRLQALHRKARRKLAKATA